MKLVSPTYFRDQYIQEIIDNFNWEKVHKVMNFLNWRWIRDGDLKCPTIEEMKKSSIEYLKEVYISCLRHKDYVSMGSGGFMARAHYSNELKDVGYLGLEFVLNDWDLDEDYLLAIKTNKHKHKT